MLRVWYLLCFFFGSGLSSSGVHRPDGSLLEESESALKDASTAGIMLVRMKRSPARTMTISGYMPNGGLSYASTDLMFPYGSMGYPGGMDMWPYSSQAHPKIPSKDLEPPSRSDSYGAPEDSAAPVTELEPNWPEKENNNGMTMYSVPKKKKKQWFQKVSPPTTADEDAEEEFYKGGKNNGAKAQASFNAWFPIMVGMFPYGQGGGAPGESGRGTYYPSSSHGPSSNGPQGSYGSQSSGPSSNGPPGSYGSQNSGPSSNGPHGSYGSQSSGPPHSQAPLQRYHSTTVIANSVNNGKSGIASSTATAYGGEQPQHQQQPRYNA